MATLEPAILGPALLAGLLVLSTHVPLGQEVLRRGIIFIDLAIAQIAGLGIIAAHSFGLAPDGWAVQLIAVGSAMLGALLLSWAERRWQDDQEAVIGVVFVLAATGGILMLANNAHGGEHLQTLLSGQILWVNPRWLLWVAGLYALLLLVYRWLGSRASRVGFYLIFALAITASVQLVGVYLVFSSLIVPALATRRLGLTAPARLMLGYTIGVFGYAGGLLVSSLLDMPSGPVIVWCLALTGLAVKLAWPQPRHLREQSS